MFVSLNKIKFIDNSRATIKDNDLHALMESIKQDGQLQPVLIAKNGKKGQYNLVAGHRRYMAVKKLGNKKIYCNEVKADKISAKVLNLVENIQRRDINIVEQGRYMRELRKLKLTDKEIAARLSIGVRRVQNAIQAFDKVPSQYRDKVIIKQATSKKQSQGTVSLSSATKILDAARCNKLKKPQVASLFKLAEKGKLNYLQLNLISGHLNKGTDFTTAVKEASRTSICECNFILSDKERRRLTKAHPKYRTTSKLFQAMLAGKVKGEKVKFV